MVYKFSIIGKPVPKGRPKFSSFLRCHRCKRNFRPGKGAAKICPECGHDRHDVIGSARTPKKSLVYENQVAAAFATYYGHVVPTEMAVKVVVRAFFPPPKNIPKYLVKEISSMDVPYPKQPDIDNIIKSILDGLNRVVYQDDKLVYSVTCEKYYSYQPRAEVVIETQEPLVTAKPI